MKFFFFNFVDLFLLSKKTIMGTGFSLNRNLYVVMVFRNLEWICGQWNPSLFKLLEANQKVRLLVAYVFYNFLVILSFGVVWT